MCIGIATLAALWTTSSKTEVNVHFSTAEAAEDGWREKAGMTAPTSVGEGRALEAFFSWSS
jgi:hypothetical protein